MPAGTTDWKGEVCTLEFGSCQETLCSTSHGEFVTAKSTGKYKKLVKGIVFAHRDSCRACKDICRVLLDMALHERVPALARNSDPSLFSIAISVNKEYRSNCPMAVFAKRMCSMGCPLESRHVVTKSSLLVEDFSPDKHVIDHVYYFRNSHRSTLQGRILLFSLRKAPFV